jgi:squalene-hopene/tetraprenyl-beta-curcumene cyclase
LLVGSDDEAYCQPCVSPVWDTVLACHALLEVGSRRGERLRDAASYGSTGCKCSTRKATGRAAAARRTRRLGVSIHEPHYPDLDDTAAVVMAMERFARDSAGRGEPDFRASIRAGCDWVLGLQSANGGWGAFDADNTSEYLNHIPFADHGALLDPPTADVTARCVGMLAQLGSRSGNPP